MVKIIDEVLKHIPDGKISEACFEGANIVLYTKDEEFFLENKGIIKKIVDDIKKRVELRPDPKITLDMEKAEKAIKKILPKEAGVGNIIFDEHRSIVIIETEKPGLAIGKQGALLKEIRAKTFWVPLVRRTPAIRSELIENIRAVLYQNSEYRRKFLDKIGHRIYDGWIRERRNEWIRLSYFGSGRQVGRSCMLLQTPESRVLLDCGVNVAAHTPEESYPHLEAPEFDISQLDAVILSHSHIDHCGFLPWLFKMGYNGPVYCTAPTRDVSSLLLLDFVKIMKNDKKESVFDVEHIREFVKHTITLEFGEVSDITPDIRLTLYNSGHILGSAMCHLHIGNGLHNLCYGADMKYGKTMLLDPANDQFPRLETLMMEATYGSKDKVMPSPTESDDYLKKIIKDTIGRRGKVLMPILGSGRAQEIMMMIESMVRKGELDEIPVYIDGLVWDVTAIHTAYPEFLTQDIRKSIFHKEANPFLSKIFKRVGSKKERMEIYEEGGPCVLLATSGMLVGGPSVEYLKYLASDKKHSLVFSCYQGEGSMGRKIMNGQRELIFKEGNKTEMIELNMEVHRLEVSNHSDRAQLMKYIQNVTPRPKKVILNHGENKACLDLASGIHKGFRIETNAPRNLEVIRIK